MRALSLSVIITAKNNSNQIALLIEEIKKLECLEILVLLSGIHNELKGTAEEMGVTVLEFGQDVMMHKMRAFAANRAKGECLLFLDEGVLLHVEDVKKFISNVRENKADIALSSFASEPKSGKFHVDEAEKVINIIANRRDLNCASFYYIPFAITKAALELIGTTSLFVPPLAKLRAIHKGLRIEAYLLSHLDGQRLYEYEISTNQLIEECLHGILFWFRQHDSRCGYTSLNRKYELLNSDKIKSYPYHQGVTAIISACNEEGTIYPIIKSAFNAGATQVVVIENGSTDKTEELAKAAGAQVVSFPYRIGHDIGRALGPMYFPSSAYLFLDGDMVLDAKELKMLVQAVVEEGIDVALNDISALVAPFPIWDEVSWSKLFLNYMLNREDLHINNLTAIPHAISGKTIATIGAECLAIPTVATVKAVQSGLQVKAVQEINVITTNRFREELHANENLLGQLIIGDMCEGLYELLLMKVGKIE